MLPQAKEAYDPDAPGLAGGPDPSLDLMSVTGLVVAQHVPIATAVGLVKSDGKGAASKPSGYVCPYNNNMRLFRSSFAIAGFESHACAAAFSSRISRYLVPAHKRDKKVYAHLWRMLHNSASAAACTVDDDGLTDGDDDPNKVKGAFLFPSHPDVERAFSLTGTKREFCFFVSYH